ncbi:hypothetical protein D3C81_2070660 [compost metagenome]
MARTISCVAPLLVKVIASVHSRKEKRPRSWPSVASRHVFPPSMDSSTLFTPAPPSNAMPLSSTFFFSGNTSPCLTLVMKLRTGSLEIGLVCAGVVPGAMQKQSLSGTR